MYVYVIKPDSTVAMQPVGVGQMNDGTSVVEQGLQAGDKIVVRGQYPASAWDSEFRPVRRLSVF